MQVTPSLEDFSTIYATGSAQILWTELVADCETAVSAYLKLAENGRDQELDTRWPRAMLLESVEGGRVRGQHSIIALWPDLIWRHQDGATDIITDPGQPNEAIVPCAVAAKTGNALESFDALIDRCKFDLPDGLPPMVAGLFGYMGYDMVRFVERIPNINPKDTGLDVPQAQFMRPTVVVLFDRLSDSVRIVTSCYPADNQSPVEAYDSANERLQRAVHALEAPLASTNDRALDLADLAEPTSTVPDGTFQKLVNRAKEYIYAGDIFQVVLSQRFSTGFDLPPFALYRALRRVNPSPYLFFVDCGPFAVTGSSPEVLVSVDNERRVNIRPIAGTRKRGIDRAEDDALAADLLADKKELAEHLMLLDLGRNDVGRVSTVGSVDVTEEFRIELYSHVMHIVSNVIGTLRSDLTATDALAAGFPAGTVSGAPKVRAMEIIDELENTQRGIYAGAVGYVSVNGSMDTCIALRTAIVKDGKMFVQAGAGIVADSDPQSEHEECENKARALFRAAQEAVRYAQSRSN